MQITDFIDAIVKACGDVNTMSFTSDGTFTLGLAAKTSAAESTDPTSDADGVVKMYTEFGAAAVGADGKRSLLLSTMQPSPTSASMRTARSPRPLSRAPRWSLAMITAWSLTATL